jgi:hypothetical protein
MIKFRRGDTLDVELVLANKVGLKDIHIYFVHADDENEHIYWGVQRKEEASEPFPPSLETRLTWDKHIEEDQKLGVYVLDKMNFLGLDGTLIEVADSLRNWMFEVVPAGEDVPDIVEELPTTNDPNNLIVVQHFSLSTSP